MASAVGLAGTRKVIWSENYIVSASNTPAEGAVVVYGTNNGEVALPAGAAAAAVAGVVTNAGTAAAGDVVDVQKAGKAYVLLAASASVTRGQMLITANSSGHVKARSAETNCVGIGYAEETKTAGASAEWLEVTLALQSF